MLDWLLNRKMSCPGCGALVPKQDYAEHIGTRVKDGRGRCRFCHDWVPLKELAAHESEHMVRRADGQQRDHISLAPEDRYQGPLDGVPTVYVHETCGAGTGMPEAAVRSYLVNPFLYNSYTFCTGCRDYVPHAEVSWRETGQSLEDYTSELKRDYIERHGAPPCGGS